LFALPTDHAHAWRLAAWAVSAVAYAAHIGYEHFKLRSSPGVTALHVALAVAIGAIGLAAAGLVHSLTGEAAFRPIWIVALFALPAVTAIPAFLVALVVATMLRRVQPSADVR